MSYGIPRYFPGEEKAIADCVAHAENYGYGNLIFELQKAWSRKLQDLEGLSSYGADMASGIICVWCRTDKRTGKKVKKEKPCAKSV